MILPLSDGVRLLLDRGADRGLGGAPWATPLAWSRARAHREVEALLQS